MIAKKLFTIVILSVGHIVATVLVFFAAVGDTMGRFDTGAPASVGSILLQRVAATLLFPVATAAYRAHWMGAGYAGWAPVVLNSVLWGTALFSGWRAMRVRMRRGTLSTTGRN